MATSPPPQGKPSRHAHPGDLLWKGSVWSFVCGAILSLILTFDVLPTNRIVLLAGEVSTRDVRAPQRITFSSAALTKQARDQAEAAVNDIYDPLETEVGRQQAARLREIGERIAAIRRDTTLTAEQQMDAVAMIPELVDSPATARAIGTMPEPLWSLVFSEATSVLDNVMRGQIRTSDLLEVRRTLPATVRLALTGEQSQIVVDLVNNLIRPNTFLNQERTEQARKAARDGVAPISQTFERGQTIVRQGDVVDAADLEALDALGLLQPTLRWQDLVGNVMVALLVTALLTVYLIRFHPGYWSEPKYVVMVTGLFLLFAAAAKATVPNRTVIPYLFPAAALGMLISSLLDIRLGIVVSVLLSRVVSVMAGGNSELTVYVFAGAMLACLVITRVERLSELVLSGALVSLSNLIVLLSFRLPDQQTDLVGMVTLAAAALLNGGFAVGVALAGFYGLGAILDIPTPLRLLELARPTHPLMRQLLLKAPGTYHHSILVSNMAEEAAERIGADALLVRVGAFYHDIGKTVRPYFFVDNQIDGVNVHDKLDPETSAQIIISHVKDGIDLARKYKLPKRIRDFIPEHQGEELVPYFYQKAVDAAQAGGDANVDPDRFRYPGPRPQSRETGIVMLADACEATVRSARPVSSEQIEQIVRRTVTDRLEQGALNESDLTLKDLEAVREAFTTILQSVFHPRIKYPELTKKGVLSNGR